MNQSGFDIFEQTKPVNHDMIVTFTPSALVHHYQYRIEKDGVYGSFINIANREVSEIKLSEDGRYRIEIRLWDALGNEEVVTSGLYYIDKVAPQLHVRVTSRDIKIGEDFDPMDLIRASDNYDGDITSRVTTNIDSLVLSKKGEQKLIYTVSDTASNTSSVAVTLRVLERSSYVISMQAILVFLTILLFSLVFLFRKSIQKEKRVSKYSIEPMKEDTSVILDDWIKCYKRMLNRLNHLLEKSVLISKYSKRYDKYVHLFNRFYDKGMDYVSSKLVLGFLLVLIALFVQGVRQNVLPFEEALIPFLAGFFLIDVIYFVKYKLYRKRILNDLLQAIIIMNNAFKSGHSITQAILLVSQELEGPIAEEFKKMHLEITFGLSIDMAFERFSERIQLEEVTYLTASLSILNKTGGNIIKVFSSIENSLFNKKKLSLELTSLTGASRIVIYILIAVPILFMTFISLINPTYFVPLFTTPIGIFILIIMIIMYIFYIIIVRKIMKVRM